MCLGRAVCEPEDARRSPQSPSPAPRPRTSPATTRCCRCPVAISAPHNGPPMITDIGIASSVPAIARARYCCGSHWLTYHTTPGAKPLSNTPEQESQRIEMRRRLDRRHRGRHCAPADHAPRDPPARPDPPQDTRAGQLEQEIADEEDADAEAVGLGVEAEVARSSASAAKLTFTRSSELRMISKVSGHTTRAITLRYVSISTSLSCGKCYAIKHFYVNEIVDD